MVTFSIRMCGQGLGHLVDDLGGCILCGPKCSSTVARKDNGLQEAPLEAILQGTLTS